MTESSRISPSVLRIALILATVSVCSGCRLLPWGDSVAHVKGHWTGRVVPVTVYDDFGGIYEAALLEVEPGSENITSRHKVLPPLGAELGGGRMPLLVRAGEGIPTVIPAAKLPVGKRVRVRGQRMKYTALTPDDSQPSRTTRVSRIQPDPPDELTDFEHVLVVRRLQLLE